MVQGVSGKRRLLVRFHCGCEKDLASDQLTIMAVDRNPMTEESEVTTIYVIPDENIYLDKG